MGATDQELWELRDGIDELSSWISHQKSLPQEERVSLGGIRPTMSEQ